MVQPIQQLTVKMASLKQNDRFTVVLLSLLLCFSASSQLNTVKVVVTNPKNDICLIKLNEDSDYLDDTVYLSNENIGILNCRKSDILYGSLFEFVKIDENGNYVIISEFNSKLKDKSGFYYMHGMFYGENGEHFLVILLGNKKYLKSMASHFNPDSNYFVDKVKKGINYKLE